MSALDTRMRNVLAQMEVFLSYGTTQAFDATGTRAKATGGDRPSGDSTPTHDHYRHAYNACTTDLEREHIIAEAERELAELLKTRPPAVAPEGSIHWKREIANSPEPMERVLRLYGISRASYFRYRRDYMNS